MFLFINLSTSFSKNSFDPYKNFVDSVYKKLARIQKMKQIIKRFRDISLVCFVIFCLNLLLEILINNSINHDHVLVPFILKNASTKMCQIVSGRRNLLILISESNSSYLVSLIWFYYSN